MESVILHSKDEKLFSVNKETAKLFGLVNNLLLDNPDAENIPLPEVESDVLEKIINFTKSETPNEFLNNFNRSELLKMIYATNYLDYKELLDLTMKQIVKNIKNKTPQEIREYFGIESDFTPEEEEQVRKENEWIEQE